MRITDTLMSSDLTGHSARWSPDAAADGQGAWIVSWLPSRLLTRNQAITAMTLAETVGDDEVAHRMQPHVDGWAAELGLTGPDATRLATRRAS